MKLSIFLFSMLSAAVASAATYTVQQRALLREVDRINPAALERFADDWEATYGESADLVALRTLIKYIPFQKQAAVDALHARGDDQVAKDVVLGVKRAILAQPLFKNMEILSTKYDYGVNARRQGAPGQPSMACYNMVEAWKHVQ